MSPGTRNTPAAACCRRVRSNKREQLIFETPAGQRITLQDGPPVIVVEDSNGNSVKLEAGGITISAAAKVTVNASVVEISSGTLTVNAGMTKFSGVVQADTVIATSIVNASGGTG
jgi:hypothetical protein